MTSCINNVRAEAGAWLAQKRRSAPPEGSAIAEHVGLFCQLQRAGGAAGNPAAAQVVIKVY